MKVLKFNILVLIVPFFTLTAFAKLNLNNYAFTHMGFGTYGSGLEPQPDSDSVSQAKKIYQAIDDSYLNSDNEKVVTLINSSPEDYRLKCSEPQKDAHSEFADCIFFGIIDLTGKKLLDYQVGDLTIEKTQARNIYLAIDKKYETPLNKNKVQKKIGNLNCIYNNSNPKNEEYTCTFYNVEFTTLSLKKMTQMSEDFTEQMANELLTEAGYK